MSPVSVALGRERPRCRVEAGAWEGGEHTGALSPQSYSQDCGNRGLALGLEVNLYFSRGVGMG